MQHKHISLLAGLVVGLFIWEAGKAVVLRREIDWEHIGKVAFFQAVAIFACWSIR